MLEAEREVLRRLKESPELAAEADAAVGRRLKDLRPVPPPRPQTLKPYRRKGGGRRPGMTDDEIRRGRELYRGVLRVEPKLRKEDRQRAAARVRTLLDLDPIVTDRTIIRHIIWPVLKAGSEIRRREQK